MAYRKPEAKHLSRCVKRKPIEIDIVNILLEASNYTCCVCKGVKGQSYIIHHIEEYEKHQDNTYNNLAVLCPNDHDLAHRPGGLSNDLTSAQVRSAKDKWGAEVELINAQRAARAVTVNDDAIDYINVMRIEELCIRVLGKVPPTSVSPGLMRAGILNIDLHFDQKFVRQNLSGGRYLFDYTNHSEGEHYRQLLAQVAQRVDFEDLSEAAGKGYAALNTFEGRYAFFIGGVYSKQPDLPIDNKTPPIVMHYTTKKVKIDWDLDPNYLYSASAISRMGRKNRYIIYCLVRTVEKGTKGSPCSVIASPLLIAQPAKYVNKMPAIAYQRQFEEWQEQGLIEL